MKTVRIINLNQILDPGTNIVIHRRVIPFVNNFTIREIMGLQSVFVCDYQSASNQILDLQLCVNVRKVARLAMETGIFDLF